VKIEEKDVKFWQINSFLLPFLAKDFRKTDNYAEEWCSLSDYFFPITILKLGTVIEGIVFKCLNPALLCQFFISGSDQFPE
jgi:hypothetical protein